MPRRPATVRLLAALLLLLAPRCAHAAGPPVRVENVRVGLGNNQAVAAWNPVWVDLSASAPFEGQLEVACPDDDGTPAAWIQPIQVQPGTPLTTLALIRPGAPSAEITIRILDAQGKALTRPIRPEDIRGHQPPNDLQTEQSLILCLGKPAGIDQVPALADTARGDPNAPPSLVVAEPALPEGLPGIWYALEPASRVVLDGSSPAVLQMLPNRAAMLRDWVRNGGHLIVATAAHGQEIAEALGDLAPVKPAGTTRLNDLGAIESFAGSTANPLPARALDVSRLQMPSGPGRRILAGSSDNPLIVRAAYGFGRVTWVGLDVDNRPFADWKDKPLFWSRVLDLRAAAPEKDAQTHNTGGFFRSGVSDLSAGLSSLLDQPPGIPVVPFGWVAFFVFIYILLIGPGDYLFLRKVLKRMQLTWITFPALVLATTALAYVAAYTIKGRELKVVKVDAADVDATSGIVRGSSWITLFSPQNRDFDVQFVPQDLDAAKSARKSPLPGTNRLLTWYGPPSPRIGASGMSLMNQGYAYAPPARAEGLDHVRIPVWSTKSFNAQWTAPLPRPIVEADLVAQGADRVDGSITNLSGRPWRKAALIYGDQVYDQIGNIAPGATARINAASRTRPISGYLEERGRGFLSNDAALVRPAHDTPELLQNRLADLMRTLMFRDSMSRRSNAPPSAVLRGLDLSGLLALDRPMLVVEVDEPAASLEMPNSTLVPNIVQTTVLRILLPIGPHE